MDRLTVRYEHSRDDDFGWLEAVVETGANRWRGGFWVQWQDLDDFADDLMAYPIAAESPLEGKWGFNRLEDDDLIIGIRVGPVDRVGHLLAIVELADHIAPAKRIRTSFKTGYAELQDFARSLKRIVAKGPDQAKEAVLTGS